MNIALWKILLALEDRWLFPLALCLSLLLCAVAYAAYQPGRAILFAPQPAESAPMPQMDLGAELAAVWRAGPTQTVDLAAFAEPFPEDDYGVATGPPLNLLAQTNAPRHVRVKKAGPANPPPLAGPVLSAAEREIVAANAGRRAAWRALAELDALFPANEADRRQRKKLRRAKAVAERLDAHVDALLLAETEGRRARAAAKLAKSRLAFDRALSEVRASTG